MANRKDLIARFGISIAQAALDFRVYLELAHRSPPTYDAGRKTYVSASPHEPLVSCSLTDAFDVLANEDEPVHFSELPRPERHADPLTISLLHQAIREQKALHVRYTSMSSGKSGGQWIVPTLFTTDGENVHIRAYSYKHEEYRHYLPIRIEPESTFAEENLVEPLPVDDEWHTKATIWLRPKSGLTRQQAKAVRREFGFDGKFLRVETRKALEFFFDRRWRLGEKGTRVERVKTEYESPIPATSIVRL